MDRADIVVVGIPQVAAVEGTQLEVVEGMLQGVAEGTLQEGVVVGTLLGVVAAGMHRAVVGTRMAAAVDSPQLEGGNPGNRKLQNINITFNCLKCSLACITIYYFIFVIKISKIYLR